MSEENRSQTGRPWWVRAAVVALGALVAAVMVFLGLWQMQVFQDKEAQSAEHRAAEPPVSLLERIPPGADVGDVYGRTVTVQGTYIPDRAVPVRSEGITRQLTALKLTDGRVLPVVVGQAEQVPSLPSGTTSVRGIFLPAEAGKDSPTDGDALASVRLQRLAQWWPEPLAPGFVTLDAAGSQALGVTPATVTLPKGRGSAQNMGYALQWWVFAASALGGAILIARSMRPATDAAPLQSDHDA